MKVVSKIALAGLILGLGGFSGNALRADEDHPMAMKGENRQKNQEKHLEKMTKKFNLTPDQQAQVRKLMDDKMSKMDEIQKNFHEQFRGILTDEQKKKWDTMESKEKKHGWMEHK